jgi:primosomal protein N' (replication factor Y)
VLFRNKKISTSDISKHKSHIFAIVNNSIKYADIILPLPLPQLFSYFVPTEFETEIAVGKRVVVQFGRKNFYTGIVHKIHTEKPIYTTKPIVSVLDSAPIISDKMFRFWDWISEYYLCALGDVYKAALPSGMKPESETILTENNDFSDFEISEKEELVLGLIKQSKKLNINELQNKTEFNVLPVVKSLIDKGAIEASEKMRETFKPKKEIFIRLSEKLNSETEVVNALDSLKRAPKQAELLMSFLLMSKYGSEKFDGLKPFAEIKRTDLLAHAQATPASLDGLLKREFLIAEQKEIGRLNSKKTAELEMKVLNKYQTAALAEIHQQFEQKDTVLLHGVTSSGKTEIYIRLIDEQIKLGKQVLYLLPEIALTTQITSRLKTIFGNKIGIYHSKFNDSERVEIWNNLENENSPNAAYQIILGVRSSIFLPFSNLGLIIVDEEHENTFKQFEPAPRYNARDSAVVLAQIHKAKVLLGTATPSIESYFNAKTGKYGLVELFNRYQNILMPEIITADTSEARRKKQIKLHFTPILFNAISEALKNREQVILFQNRRGFSPSAECETCGWVPKCENCDVSLTYHKHSDQLVCHYCGYGYQTPHTCKACGSATLKMKGFGTERIEEEISELFPQARTARMDTDTTRNKNSFQKMITDFEDRNIDILIGTQMVSKGLDFDNVSIVGIMNADNLLNFPDFRAYERSFQLMMQVSGRAGRKGKQGKVILQTADPKNSVIQYIKTNNYKALFNSEIAIRRNFKYPPFYRLLVISLKHTDFKLVDAAAENAAELLRNVFGNRVLGPEYPLVSRIQNKFIKNIMLKIERDKSAPQAKKYLTEILNTVKSNEKFKSVMFSVNVDPM